MAHNASPLRQGRAAPYRCALAGVVLVCVMMGAQAQAQALEVRVLASDAWGLTLEAIFPAVEIRQIPEAQAAWHEVVIAGLSPHRVLGSPVLPRHGALIGIPEGVGLNLILIDAVPGEGSGARVAPAIVRTADDPSALSRSFEQALDPAVYGVDEWYPAAPVSLGFRGRLRGQAVAQVLFHPVLYHPLLERVEAYRSLRVLVVFDRPLVSAGESDEAAVAGIGRQAGSSGEPFEAVIRESLINYHQLGR